MRRSRLRLKDSTSPGLLSYCGNMMVELRKFVSIEQFQESARAANFSATSPYIIEECSTLVALLEKPVVKTTFGNFRSQLVYTSVALGQKLLLSERFVFSPGGDQIDLQAGSIHSNTDTSMIVCM